MPASPKDVIYLDVDDEITAIIEKVQSSSSKIICLVLPKRASVFQSIVNMKLLKRTAASSKKNIVLITSEQNILPLAGAVGLHVARTLQTKPIIPDAPSETLGPVTVDEIEVDDEISPAKSAVTAAALKPVTDQEETIELDDEPNVYTSKASKQKVNKKLKVPDFNKFRTKLLLGGGLLALLIIAFIFASVVLPKATVVIKTNNTEIASEITVTSSPSISELDAEDGQVRGALKEFKKTEVQKVPATGQKDMGTKAEGNATITIQVSCTTAQPASIPSGTTISSGNLSFITQAPASFTYTGTTGTPPNVQCSWKSNSVNVTADKAGDQYNLSPRDYSVAGYSNATAKGNAMSGGTSRIVKVVSQKDIDDTKQKIIDAIAPTANQETSKLLAADNFFALTDTFVTKDPIVTSSPGVDAEAEEVTVSVTLSFTMAGAEKSDLEKLLEAELKTKIDVSQQKILNNGLDNAAVAISNKKPNGETTFRLQTRAETGVEQNEADIKQAIAGKKKSEAETTIKARQGVQEVTVEYSPFWVSKVPEKQSKITVVFESQGK